MLLPNVLQEIRALSRLEKLKLIQILAEELAIGESDLIEPHQVYAVWSPESAFSAANELLQTLSEEKTSL